MELITDLNEIKRRAAERRDEFEVMRYMIEDQIDLTDAEVDAMVDELAAPIIAAIDCTACGNCCRSLDVGLTPKDVDRLSAGIHVPVDAIISEYVDRERGQEMDEWGVFRQKPCALFDGRLCTVYEHRPESCRQYPWFTPDFRWTLEYTLAGAGLCPIIYNVLDALQKKVDRM